MTKKGVKVGYFKQLLARVATYLRSQLTFINKLQKNLLLRFYPQQALNSPSKKVRKNVFETSGHFVGVRLETPPLWRRFIAELFDFKVLFFISFFIEYYLFGSIVKMQISGYNRDYVPDMLSVNYKILIDKIVNLIFVEALHRIIVCVYEIYLLQGYSGATLGKYLFRIRVVRADKLFHIRGQPDNVFATTSVSDLSWKHAAYRSVIKNLFSPFLVPLNVLIYNANQNKFFWDIMCGSIAVEAIQPLKCKKCQLIPVT